MAGAEVKPQGGVCAGMVAGVVLMMFAGALVATSHGGVDSAANQAGAFLRKLTPVVTATTTDVTSTLTVDALSGQNVIGVASAAGFVMGNSIVVGMGSAINETARVTIVGELMTLKQPLKYTHPIGSVVAVQADSFHQQILNQLSSGSLSPLRTSDSSGSATSMNSLGSLESGSLEGNLPKTMVTYESVCGLIGWAVQFLVFLCFGCIYKRRVVDPMGVIGHQALSYDMTNDFKQGICGCWKDCNTCMMVTCCPLVRMAHTNQVAGVCGFWETLCCLGCSSLCCYLGPCCLNVYFRIHIKDHMGIEDHCFNDMFLSWCCLPCITGQQAMAVDEAQGFKVKFPCSLERYGYGGGYGGNMETQQLNWS